MACLLLLSLHYPDATAASTLQASAAAAFRGSFGLRLVVTACAGDAPSVDVTGPPLTVSAVFEACNVLTADVSVEAPADVTFRSGRTIRLQDGHGVADGATLRTETVPSLLTVAYVQDANPASESSYHARWYLDLTQMALASDTVRHFDALSGAGGSVLQLRLDRVGGQNRVTLVAVADDASEIAASPVVVADGWRAVEIEWHASSGADDGELRLYVDDTEVAALTGLDNDTLRVETIRLGATDFIDGSAAGTMDLDEFSSRNDGRIGL